ncbi:MAG: hypothetical protein K8R41_02585 [Bacteroidales bacterium]|nr:hypothetical protein [Bacteroidales bacterium]
MKTSLLYFLLSIFLLSSNHGCTFDRNKDGNNGKKNTEARLWWNTLNDTWKIVFLREIDKIDEKPTEEDLVKIINLQKVDCDHFPLGETNLEPLRMLKRLKSVYAGSTFIQNINALSDLDSLLDVSVPDNHISSLEPLRGHKMLETLYVQINDVKNLDPLADKNKLQVLVIFSTEITTIASVMDLPALSIFQVSEENIPVTELQTFKRKHPDCDVNF